MLLGEVARLAPPGRVGAATAALGFAFAGTMIVKPMAFALLMMITGGYAWGFVLCATTAAMGTLALLRLRPAPGGPR